MTNTTRKIECVRVKGASTTILEEQIAVENHLKLIANGKLVTEFIASPEFNKQLIVGHLISENHISSYACIKDLRFVGTDSCEVNYSCSEQKSNQKKEPAKSIGHEELLEMKEFLLKGQKLHKSTRGFHGATITDLSTNKWFLCEDIGRHNAVDKAIGYAAENDYDFSKCLILISGRLISNMVRKGCNAGIAGMVSITVATDKGIEAAKEANMTLIGSLSKDGFWLYNEGAIKIKKVD